MRRGAADAEWTTEMTAPLLQAQSLDFRYAERAVFAHWSADFRTGITWLRGANGSGKSTLLRLLAGALAPQGGRLAVNGIDAAADPRAYRREVFWCGPGAIAFDHLTPLEYFGFLRGLYPRFAAAALPAQLDALGLQPFVGSRLSTLSTGTQRKVWLAAALVVGTTAVLLDEPLNALDRASLGHLREQLARCAASPATAWIVASHESIGGAADGAAVIDL
jgi:ABC-type multidrug transport system ATPase subunit